VRQLNQFRLTDGPVLPGGGFAAYREFQSGLMFRSMREKPAYDSFRHPFVARHRSGRVRLWGHVRPGRRHTVTVERRRGRSWRRVARLRTGRRGYWRRVQRGPKGIYRYRWGRGEARTSDALRVR
jgi:hypothetical protein